MTDISIKKKKLFDDDDEIGKLDAGENKQKKEMQNKQDVNSLVINGSVIEENEGQLRK